ncbi:MAG: mannitol dehydrogenase family protein [Pusillimonas sp.]|nr:mannitol dehydrogenase family protein [Pusillimonas sp.]
MNRLSPEALQYLPELVVRPEYERNCVPIRIVHLGAGAFFRSHLAVYTDEVMKKGDTRWGIMGVSLRSPGVDRALTPQNGLYSVIEQDAEHIQVRVVGSVVEVVSLPDEPDRVLRTLIQPQIAIVSMTLTDKGYGYDACADCLKTDDPDIARDLENPRQPRSAIGVLAWAVAQRKRLGYKPFTLMSCDNIPANGKVLQRVLEQYIKVVQAAFGDKELLRYFLDQYACPCTLVDRLTPQVQEADVSLAAQLLGVQDAAPVVTEPYSLFVLQDWFSNERPAWERAGAVATAHVSSYEKLRYRLLDASYLAIGYLGYFEGFTTLYEAHQNPGIRQFVAQLMDDAAATLGKRPEYDWRTFKQEWIRRFDNPALRVGTAQLRIETSHILLYAIVPAVADRLRHRLSIDRHAKVLALWIRWLMRASEADAEPLDDLRAELLLERVNAAGGAQADPGAVVDSVLSFEGVFGTKLSKDAGFKRAVTAALQQSMVVS